MTAQTSTYRTYGHPTTADSVGDWEGQEALAAEQIDRVYVALIEAAQAAGVSEDETREILSTAWDVWGSEPGLLTITDAQIATYVAAHVRAEPTYPHYRVLADAETGQWIGDAEATGEQVARALWDAKQDTAAEHYDTYEVDDETRAITVEWVRDETDE